MAYIHQIPKWPRFEWDVEALAEPLARVRHRQGFLLGRMAGLGFQLRAEASLETLAAELIQSSAIEGEILDLSQVRSSLAKSLGLEFGGYIRAARHIDGLVEMILDATRNYAAPLSKERLFGWQAALFPSGFSGLRKIAVGRWRTPESGPMQVVSGPFGGETVHFEAPPAEKLEAEMDTFLAWVNASASIDPILKAAIAHFWFITIHPFEDGNGRIARAIADFLFARADQSAERFYSLSRQIEKERDAYYDILEESQKSGLNITAWLTWFIGCLDRALDAADEALNGVKQKNTFWQKAACHQLNTRQRLVLARLLDDFKGKLSSGKYAKLAKCSHDTALRDLKELADFGLLVPAGGGGRSSGYILNEELMA